VARRGPRRALNSPACPSSPSILLPSLCLLPPVRKTAPQELSSLSVLPRHCRRRAPSLPRPPSIRRSFFSATTPSFTCARSQSSSLRYRADSVVLLRHRRHGRRAQLVVASALRSSFLPSELRFVPALASRTSSTPCMSSPWPESAPHRRAAPPRRHACR
jgi:hypothetical protein